MNRMVVGLAALLLLSRSISVEGQQLPLTVAKLQAPGYPPIARAARVQGDVTLRVELGADGIPSAVSVLKWAADAATGRYREHDPIPF